MSVVPSGLNRLAARVTTPMAVVRIRAQADEGPSGGSEHSATWPTTAGGASTPMGPGSYAGPDQGDVDGTRVAGTVDTGRDRRIGDPAQVPVNAYGGPVGAYAGQIADPAARAATTGDDGGATDADGPFRADMTGAASPATVTAGAADHRGTHTREPARSEPFATSSAGAGAPEFPVPGIGTPHAARRARSSGLVSEPRDEPGPEPPSAARAVAPESALPTVQIGRIDVQVTAPAASADPFAGCRAIEGGLTARRGGGW